MGATGLELTPIHAGNTDTTTNTGADSGAQSVKSLTIPSNAVAYMQPMEYAYGAMADQTNADLVFIASMWPKLSAAERAGIMEIVSASKGR